MLYLKSVVVVMLVLVIGSVLAGSSIQVSNPQASNFTCPFTSQTSVTCTHNLGTTAVLVDVYNAASPPVEIFPTSVTLTSNNVVTVTFSSSQSGTVVINGSNGSGGGGGSSFYQTIQVAGVNQPQEPALNFASNVTCTDTSGVSTNCTPSGGGGGGSVPTTGWTLLNMTNANATFSDFSSTIASLGAEPVSATDFAMAYQAIPGSTYTITATLQTFFANRTEDTQSVGLALTDGTKFEEIDMLMQNSVSPGQIQLRVITGTSLHSGSFGVLAGPTTTLVNSNPTFRIKDTGTTRTWAYYSNGAFVTFYSEASGTFLTPIGDGPTVENSDTLNGPGVVTNAVITWSATTP
jgi:hypothetical protein